MGFNPSAAGQFLGHHNRLGGCWAKSSTRGPVVSGTDRGLCLPLPVVLCSALLILSAQRFTASAITGSLINQIGKYCTIISSSYTFLFLAGGNACFLSAHSLKANDLGGFWVVLAPTTVSPAHGCA